ncbi:MAG: hypothetical protein ABIP41_01675 [Croceibacterium sp.]
MNLPHIDLSILPDLDTVAGIFGSVLGEGGHDDSIVILATFVYESTGGLI